MLKVQVSLMKRKLYVYKENKLLRSYSIAIGKEISPTPVGNYKVLKKYRLDKLDHSKRCIEFFKDYGIAGTLDEENLGKAVSAGDIVMNSKDIVEFHNLIRVGTQLEIEY
ncbi:MAG: L,D-transpeptidase [Bacillota bacterium]|nr:L,D-transpeptidase [Bacillota bacterium]